MTRRCRCSSRAAAKPKPGDCGRMCGTIGPQEMRPPAVWYCYTPDRKGRTSASALAGILPARCRRMLMRATRGLRKRSHPGSRLLGRTSAEVLRLAGGHKSPVAAAAVRTHRGTLCIEQEIRDVSQRSVARFRNTRSRPLLESLKQWLEETLGKLSRKSDTALGRSLCAGTMEALLRYCDDGRLEIDNNAAERSCVPWCWKKKLFYSTIRRWGRARRGDLQLISSAKLNGLNPKLICATCWNVSPIIPSTASTSSCLEPRQRTCSRLAPRCVSKPSNSVRRLQSTLNKFNPQMRHHLGARLGGGFQGRIRRFQGARIHHRIDCARFSLKCGPSRLKIPYLAFDGNALRRIWFGPLVRWPL